MTISRRTTTLVAAGLLAAYAVLSLLASLGRGPAFDETAHIAAGYNVWLRHDLRFRPRERRLYKALGYLAAPQPLRPVFPDRLDSDWRNAEFFAVGYKLLFKLGNDPLWILLVCRAMVMAFSCRPWSAGIFLFAVPLRECRSTDISFLVLLLSFDAGVWGFGFH